MSDQEPLLPSHNGEAEEHLTKTTIFREKTAAVLEHRHLHKAVIFLVSRTSHLFSQVRTSRTFQQITLDAACVLADLVYTFLSPGCEPPEGPDAPQWLEVLSHISLAITTFFLIEIPLSVFAFGPGFYRPFGSYPHASLHFFDALIIMTTFILEVVLRGRERELASLLIILRLWRLVKLVGGETFLRSTFIA